MKDEERIPQAVHEGRLTLLGKELRVYVLDDGRRVVDEESFAAFLELLQGGETFTESDMRRLAEFVHGKGGGR